MKVTEDMMSAVAKTVCTDTRKVTGARVLALHGNLGAGKTTFAGYVARSLGIIEDVVSPTFVIMKKYTTDSALYDTLVHIDAYRIESITEATQLRFGPIFADSRTCVVVEWPEHIKEFLPADTQHITLAYIDDTHRDILGV
jgi:tRNA threonylcarbamoyladenosine biosynthesis protein TsaE